MTTHRRGRRNEILIGDCVERMRELPDGIVQTCVTSPPYFGLRDYKVPGQIGQEKTPAEFVARLVEVFREVRRVLRNDGTLWLNLGDSYATGGGKVGRCPGGGEQGERFLRQGMVNTQANRMKLPGLKSKELIGIPWKVAFALQEDGWYLRQDIIWSKPNPMPESVRDRCTKSHEYLFLLSKSKRYSFDRTAIQEPAVTGWNGSEFHTGKTAAHQLGRSSKNRKPRPAGNKTHKYVTAYQESGTQEHRTKAGLLAQAGVIYETRNRRSVWSVAIQKYKGAHFATFPPKLIEPCILAGCPVGGLVLDPFGGTGTTAQVARHHGRDWLICELNPEYAALADVRIATPLVAPKAKKAKRQPVHRGQLSLFEKESA